MRVRSMRPLVGRLPLDVKQVLQAVESQPQPGESALATRLREARDAAARVLGESAHDSQILGAAALATGRVVQMLTGEGKTLTAALAVSAMQGGGGVHVATANDYLAGRDAAWMEPLYASLGMSVGVTTPPMGVAEKQAAYRCDVTYGTAREFAFDYLRDSLTAVPERRVQQGHSNALIDEIDFILLDEARIPFVVTRATPADSDGLADAAALVATLNAADDYLVDEGQRSAWLTEDGIDRVEAVIGVGAMDDPGSRSAANVQAALRSMALLHRDRHYVVVGGRVDIVDEFTGRVIAGRRWADGLHQAVEAKEGVRILDDSRALAQTTVRNYFNRYQSVVGMSGTATAAFREFRDVYELDVVDVPPHRPVVRVDHPDRVFATAEEKFGAVVDEIVERHATGQPILAGTTTVAHSEYLSALLRERSIEHRVLNAKLHEAEAAVIAEAGREGSVTVATNMAGRGVDIRLGGGAGGLAHKSVAALGGLCVIGTDRHDSGRVDDQLRGRSGRQGDPGESIFFASLEDELAINHGPQLAISGRLRPRRAVEVAQSNAEIASKVLRSRSHEYDEILDGHYNEICRFRETVVDDPGFSDWVSEKALGVGGRDAIARLEDLKAEIGDDWPTVVRRAMYADLEHGWSSVLETMHGLRDWVNLVAFGGNYPITEWRRRSDAAVDLLRERIESGFPELIMSATVVRGRPPHRSETPVEQPTDDGPTVDPHLPQVRRYNPPHRRPVVPDWAEGFVGPQFQEVVQLLDPAGSDPSDPVAVVVDDSGVTVFIDRESRD